MLAVSFLSPGTKPVITVLNKRETNEGEYVGRPSPLGNPWSITKEMSREVVIAKYKAWLELQWKTNNTRVKDELFRLANILKEQGHLELLCWCAPKPCHADVIAEAVQIVLDKHI